MKLIRHGLKKSKVLPWGVLLVLALFVPPNVLGGYYTYLLDLFCVYAIICMGLNLLLGYTGLASLGHVAFVGLGAYASTLFAVKLSVPFGLSMMGGIIVAACAALVLGLVTLRLRGIYFGMATLAFALVVQRILANWTSLTGGYLCLIVPPVNVGFTQISAAGELYYLIFPITVLALLVTNNLVNSRTGRALMAIRDNELSALSLGIRTTTYKIVALVIGSAWAGLGGGLLAALNRVIGPNDFGLLPCLNYIVIVVVGGLGTMSGPLYGVALFLILQEAFRRLLGAQELVYGLILLLTLLFFQRGIAGLVSQSMESVRKKVAGMKSSRQRSIGL